MTEDTVSVRCVAVPVSYPEISCRLCGEAFTDDEGAAEFDRQIIYRRSDAKVEQDYERYEAERIANGISVQDH